MTFLCYDVRRHLHCIWCSCIHDSLHQWILTEHCIIHTVQLPGGCQLCQDRWRRGFKDWQLMTSMRLLNTIRKYFIFPFLHIGLWSFILNSFECAMLCYTKVTLLQKETKYISASPNVKLSCISFLIRLIFRNYISLFHLQEDVTVRRCDKCVFQCVWSSAWSRFHLQLCIYIKWLTWLLCKSGHTIKTLSPTFVSFCSLSKK